MTDTERLVAFLLDRIEDDTQGAGDIHRLGCDATLSMPMDCDCAWPARVLADCAALRAVLTLLRQYEAAIRQEGAVAQPGDPLPKTLYAARDALEEAVRLLAQPHSDHPAFDPAWRLEQHAG